MRARTARAAIGTTADRADPAPNAADRRHHAAMATVADRARARIVRAAIVLEEHRAPAGIVRKEEAADAVTIAGRTTVATMIAHRAKHPSPHPRR